MLTVDEFMKTTRILGFYFLRKRFLHHIFYSKMEKQNIHLKYIHRWKAIFQDPANFRSLKWYDDEEREGIFWERMIWFYIDIILNKFVLSRIFLTRSEFFFKNLNDIILINGLK